LEERHLASTPAGIIHQVPMAGYESGYTNACIIPYGRISSDYCKWFSGNLLHIQLENGAHNIWFLRNMSGPLKKVNVIEITSYKPFYEYAVKR
jgi:hypothetical protein